MASLLAVSGCAGKPASRPFSLADAADRQFSGSTAVLPPPSKSTQVVQPAAYDVLLTDSDDRFGGASVQPPEAQENSAESMSGTMKAPPGERRELDSLIADAIAAHPGVQAARQRVAAARNRIPQAAALPDPVFSNTFWPIRDQALQTAGGRVGNQMALNQNVPWPSKLEARTNVARRELLVAQAKVIQVQREVTEAVQLAYYQWWLAEATLRIVDRNREVIGELITITEARYAAGGSQQDVLRAELEGDRLDDQRIGLRRQLEQARADLATLAGRSVQGSAPESLSLDPDGLAPDLERLFAGAQQCNPVLQGLAAEIARDREKERLACQQKYPDLHLGMGWSLIADSVDVISPVADGHDNVNFTVGVTLPIWRDKINAGVREATHQRSSTVHRHQAERDHLRGQLRRQVAELDAAVAQWKLFQER
ncbi:MAG: TolC family protein, partial [Pirellulales bacterium]|nr:TolC family protein [Pirellulales bacterium]